ncbi:tripartite-type tricarboxylate transporter receptor subunit TctC [Bradyrhizobium japonicum]
MARRFILALAVSLFAALSASPSWTQDYPNHAVRIVVPFGAGGPADVAARLIGNVLQESFGQPFVVENRTGAGGVIGTVEAAKSPADGYTLLMMSNTQTANESLLTPDKRKYELMRDLAPIAPVNYSDLVIVVNPQVPAKTLQEFIALAKSQPGKLNYASSGQGTPYHMAGELFKAMAGIDVVHVPYRNSGEARSGVIGGQVQMMIDAVPAMAPNIGENQVRALATTGKERSAVLPNVPTASEAGVAGYEATIWLGLMAPAGTPKPVIDKLNAAVNAMVKRPDIVKLWTEQGAVPMSMTPEEFEKFLRGDIEKMGRCRQEVRQVLRSRSDHADHSISAQRRGDGRGGRSRPDAARCAARPARRHRSAFRLRSR